ncbi:MAG: phosphoribosyl-ATP diphosphatase [Anaerolineales bacterium]|nr:phosphoribosyl-ATP diphosphatase [Anaerolineales bacterium]
MIEELYTIILERKTHPQPGSYTHQLLQAGVNKILKKINEEATELIVAAKAEGDQRLVEEVADLFYHTLVLLASREIDLEAVKAELRRRNQPIDN